MNIQHVYPVNDLREHKTDGKPCWCNPRIEKEFGGTIIVHNSMDRREEYEQGRKLS